MKSDLQKVKESIQNLMPKDTSETPTKFYAMAIKNAIELIEIRQEFVEPEQLKDEN